LHVEHQRLPDGEDVEACVRDLELLDRALGVLAEDVFSKGVTEVPASGAVDGRRAALHVIDAGKRYEHLKEFSRQLKGKITEWQDWGDFDPAAIRDLRERGIFVRLYAVPVKEVDRLAGDTVPAQAMCRVLFTSRGMAYCAVVSRKEDAGVPFKEIEVPEVGLAKMRLRLEENQRVMETLAREVRASLCHRGCLEHRKAQVERELEFRRAVCGMGEAGSLAYLVGYAPVDKTEDVRAAARRHAWGMLVEDPASGDRVPTLIRNPRWVSVIAPLFKVIEVVPGYRETDISLWVLIFLSVFFGMLIGDAGYGLVFGAATFLFQRKGAARARERSPFILMYVFSGCAVLWGILTGTYFGQAWLPEGVVPLVPALREGAFLQTFCFFLGALHLSIGHMWHALNKAPSKTALADAGWVAVLWGAFFLARTLILGAEFPVFAKGLFIAGPLLVVSFSSENRNIFKALGAGLGQLLLNVVNSFTDVVSYVRLFAVGLATVAVADAFNAMAADVGFNSVVAGFAAALILTLGHLLNIVLGPMAVLVHGVRLNVLEFCNHVDVKWGGFAYRPLAQEEHAMGATAP